jgi:ATP-dependent DNA helicase RecG
MSAYADLDVSTLDELPPGRTPVRTVAVANTRRGEVIERIRAACAEGRQAYWVCTLIEESDEVEAQDAQATFEALQAALPGVRVALVHGRQKAAEKQAAMLAFKRGDTGLLVATTVIEVGVDVPNATLMIVEGAERFGLAQLHQLRGRVGRGTGKSVCLLIRGQTLTEVGRARLALMRETSDGFRVAEEDLRLRGPGEILGTRQSGEEAFRVATPELVAELAPIAQSDALLLLDRDGGLKGERGQAARVCLYLFERDQAIALIRSG